MCDLDSQAEITMRRASLINARDTKCLEAIIALTDEVRLEAFKLRHDGYVAAGYIKPLLSGFLTDSYDALSSSTTIVLYRSGQPAASARVCLLNPLEAVSKFPLPAKEIFETEIDAILKGFVSAEPPRAVEITKLVRGSKFTKDNDLVFAMFRMAGYLILHYNADLVFSTVRPSHVPFYRRLGFVRAEHPRPYPNFDVEVSLMYCTRESYGNVRRNIPIMGRLTDDDGLMSRFIDGDLVEVFPQQVIPPGIKGIDK